VSPNWAVKRTPTLAMASPFLWPVLVPYAPSVLRRSLPWALGHGLTEALETFGSGVLQHSAPGSAEHAGMVYPASVASRQIMRLASFQAWR
jgi:hypothetical protein